ncbi:MAG: transketolase C-terminal domain-containing protein [Pseudomonadota bacterium]
METKEGSQVRVLEGNMAAAHAVLLSKPDVISCFPITPQTSLGEALSRFVADGLSDAEIVEPEGENSALSTLIGASMAGGRTFTSTSSQGLSFMYDAYLFTSGNRLPIVMAIAMREQPAPHGVVAGQQDAILVKDGGWIQFYAESCQEILDSIIMAYRLAEDPEILLPVNICYEGFFLSYQSQRVEIPAQEDVDRFLAPVQETERLKLCLENPMAFSTYTFPGELYTEYRFKHCAALHRAKQKYEQIEEEFSNIFGRSYGGQIEEYRSDDADVVIVTMGSCTGTAKAVVDRKRDTGLKVGLIKIRMFRPFPVERLKKALNGKKAIGVIDRNVLYSGFCGHVFFELKTVLKDLEPPIPVSVNFIAGLGGTDIVPKMVERVIETAYSAAEGKAVKPVTWLSLE